MMFQLNRKQYEELKENFSSYEHEFHQKLEEYAGITARPYTEYDYFDAGGDWIGNSDSSLDELLRNAYVEVTEDG